MEISEIAALGSLVIAVIVAGISAWSVVVAARRQADAALDAARHQTEVNQDLAVFQIQATLSSTSRQQWRETLRVEIAELLSELMMVQAVVVQKSMSADEVSLPEKIKRIAQLGTGISLLLDKDVPSHSALISALNAPFDTISNGDEEAVGRALNDIMNKGRLVLKEEAARLKEISDFTPRGEIVRVRRAGSSVGRAEK
jgi:hypothetical protein